MRSGPGALTAVAALLPFACGAGTDPAGNCGKVQPCGGDIVGDWNIVGKCLNDAVITMNLVSSSFGAFCPTATAHTKLTESGSLTFTAGLAYSGSATASGSLDIDVPPSCLEGTSCAEVEAAFRADLATNPSQGFTSVSCSGAGACLCRYSVDQVPVVDSGTYVTSGSTLTRTSGADGSVSQRGYCVGGDTGHLITLVSTPVGSMGIATIEGDTVMVRR